MCMVLVGYTTSIACNNLRKLGDVSAWAAPACTRAVVLAALRSKIGQISAKLSNLFFDELTEGVVISSAR